MRCLTLLFLLACGAPTPEVEPAPTVPVLPEGQYYIDAKIDSTQGTCDWLGKETGGYVSVDSKGNFQSTVPDLIGCRTQYAPAFQVTCSGLGDTMILTGRTWTDSGVIGGAGKGAAYGNVGGCTRVEFEWWGIRYDRSSK